MDVEPFALERWLARHEADAEITLAESGIRALPAADFDLDPGRLGYVVPTDGAPDLRARVGERYGRDADEVVFTCGTQEANLLAMLALVEEHAVCVTPTYQSLRSLPAALGDVTRVELSPPDWGLDVDEVAAAVRPETDLLVVNNPNNPTGRFHPRETVEALVDLAEEVGAYLLCDEVYRLLADDPLPPVAALSSRGVSTTGLSKAFGLAGLRFGWLCGPREVVAAARQWKDYTTISPPAVGQHVARQALDREAELLAAHRDLAARNRDRVRAFLAERGLSWHEPVGVDGFVTVPAGFAGGESFCRQLVREESVLLAPGEAFGHSDRFRIGFGREPDELEAGLSRLGTFLDRHGA